MADHESLMRRAIELSAMSRKNGNDPFGALLADANGRILLEAENTALSDKAVTAHAEQNLVTEASKRFSCDELNRLILYTSCEPCAMCAGAIFLARIGRLVYAAPDPKRGVLGSVISVQESETLNHHTEVVQGPMAEESGRLLRTFFEKLRNDA